MENFGLYLKTQREKKGIRLEEIASITKIHLHSLELLEAGDWSALPPEPFIRGFITAYAKYVGLEPKEALAEYQRIVKGTDKVNEEGIIEGAHPSAPLTPPPSELIRSATQATGPRILTAVLALAIVLVITVLINLGKSSQENSAQVAEKAPPIPTQVQEVPEPVKKAVVSAPVEKKEEVRNVALAPEPAKAAPQPVKQEGPVNHEVTVESKERTWMKVVIDEEPPQELFLGEGETKTYRATHKIKVVLGNSSSAKVVHNGEVAEGKKYLSSIRTYKFPANAHFPQDMASSKPAATNPADPKTKEQAPANAEENRG
jgi:cytoskeletal protein RodZ